MPRPERLDLVTHFFPPIGGPASNRMVAWARHFASRGVAVRVTTPVPHPADPYFEASHAAPPEVEVVNIEAPDLARHLRGAASGRLAGVAGTRRTWRAIMLAVRDLLDLPDHRRIWNPAALRSLERRSPAPSVLLTTSPYNSTHLIGLDLKRRHPEMLWVADFRDSWARQWERRWHTPLHRAYGRALGRRVARHADLLVFFHRVGVAAMAAWTAGAETLAKSLVVYHGVSDEAIAALDASPADLHAEPLRLTYAGTIWEWNLPPSFFSGWKRFRAALPRAAELHIVGRVEPGPAARIAAARAGGDGAVQVHGFKPHAEAIGAMARAAALLVFSGPYRESVSSKLFECIAARRPILYFGREDSAGAGILRECGAGAAVTASYDACGVIDLFDRFAAALNADDCSAFVPRTVPAELRASAQADRLLSRISAL